MGSDSMINSFSSIFSASVSLISSGIWMLMMFESVVRCLCVFEGPTIFSVLV